MLDIFSGLRLVVKRRNINIDNAIFRCHWFFTSTLLVSFSLIITARQYVGQPIECHSTDKIPDSLLNSYCWVQSTFTVPQACNGQTYGVDVPYPCIDNTAGREVRVYAYYQWVGIVLFVQGLLFHLPYYLWKLWENGLIKAITGGLRVAVLNEQERLKKKNIVVEYIHDHLGCHKRYAFKYFLCEFICLINLFGQLWATNKFFDGQFLRYGIEVMQYSATVTSPLIDSIQSAISLSSPSPSMSGQQKTFTIQSAYTSELSNATKTAGPSTNLLSTFSLTATENSNGNNNYLVYDNHQRQHNSGKQIPANSRAKQQVDPMTFVFPRMTKCTYYDFGSSGDVQKHDALCLLPLNIINEKIYIALWFWFIILTILTILVIIYRLLAIISESVRCKGLISRCKLSSERDIRLICRHCDVGDWFLFYMVAENLDPLIMREIVSAIASKINEHLELKRELREQLEREEANEHERLLRNSEHDLEKLRLIMVGSQFDPNHRHQTLLPSPLGPPPSMPSPSPPPLQTAPSAPPAPSLPASRRCSFDSEYLASIFGHHGQGGASSALSSLVEQLPYARRLKRHLLNRKLFFVDNPGSQAEPFVEDPRTHEFRGQDAPMPMVSGEAVTQTGLSNNQPVPTTYRPRTASLATDLHPRPTARHVANLQMHGRRMAPHLQRRGSLNQLLINRSASLDDSSVQSNTAAGSSGAPSMLKRIDSSGSLSSSCVIKMGSHGSTSRLDRLGEI